MSKMIEIRGQEVSEDIIVEALKKHCSFEEKKHIFKAGDVVIGYGQRRIIVARSDGTLFAVDTEGDHQTSGQRGFEANKYEYIGRLEDLLKIPQK